MQTQPDPNQTLRMASYIERRTALVDRRTEARRASPERRKEERRVPRSLLRL